MRAPSPPPTFLSENYFNPGTKFFMAILLHYLNLQGEEIHEDNIRWNAQMAGVDMVQSTRQQGSQEVNYHYQVFIRSRIFH